MTRCGDRPKVLAIGIAPLGIISIGIVPMGVVSIGVVPMGVLSVGAVAMGLVNLAVVGMGVLVAGVNVMGVWWAGHEGMGPFRIGAAPGSVQQRQRSAPDDPAPGTTDLFAYSSREAALEQARRQGCSGAHRMGSLWMPCDDHRHP
ncbi:MAG: hypothetical protein VKI63_07460 [Cyanobium sp.]|nr:hypothetical protein [Cyanobium sp.]